MKTIEAKKISKCLFEYLTTGKTIYKGLTYLKNVNEHSFMNIINQAIKENKV